MIFSTWIFPVLITGILILFGFLVVRPLILQKKLASSPSPTEGQMEWMIEKSPALLFSKASEFFSQKGYEVLSQDSKTLSWKKPHDRHRFSKGSLEILMSEGNFSTLKIQFQAEMGLPIERSQLQVDLQELSKKLLS
jgi:hypothetical protein